MFEVMGSGYQSAGQRSRQHGTVPQNPDATARNSPLVTLAAAETWHKRVGVAGRETNVRRVEIPSNPLLEYTISYIYLPT